MKFNPELIKLVENHERIENVYLNEEGGWMTNEHQDYQHKYSRNEVLGISAQLEITEEVEGTEKKKKK